MKLTRDDLNDIASDLGRVYFRADLRTKIVDELEANPHATTFTLIADTDHKHPPGQDE